MGWDTDPTGNLIFTLGIISIILAFGTFIFYTAYTFYFGKGAGPRERDIEMIDLEMSMPHILIPIQKFPRERRPNDPGYLERRKDALEKPDRQAKDTYLQYIIPEDTIILAPARQKSTDPLTDTRCLMEALITSMKEGDLMILKPPAGFFAPIKSAGLREALSETQFMALEEQIQAGNSDQRKQVNAEDEQKIQGQVRFEEPIWRTPPIPSSQIT